MFGPKGNPQARNLFEIIGCLQKRANVRFEVPAVRGQVNELGRQGDFNKTVEQSLLQ